MTHPALDLNCQMKEDGEQRHSVHGGSQREDANIRVFVCLQKGTRELQSRNSQILHEQEH